MYRFRALEHSTWTANCQRSLTFNLNIPFEHSVRTFRWTTQSEHSIWAIWTFKSASSKIRSFDRVKLSRSGRRCSLETAGTVAGERFEAIKSTIMCYDRKKPASNLSHSKPLTLSTRQCYPADTVVYVLVNAQWAPFRKQSGIFF